MKIICHLVLTLSCFEAFSQGTFTEASSRGQVENSEITEASGLAAGINNPNMLWTHNDSGDSARLFLLDEYGKFQAQFKLEGIDNRDWEDIASGPGPDASKNYLYVAEIGDNRAIYEIKYIYRFEEPNLQSEPIISVIDSIKFRFPDGIRDAESMFVDPETKDIYILSKRERNIGIYVARYPQSTTTLITLEKLGTMPYYNTVAIDITPDGQEIISKTYDQVFYWKRNNLSISDLLMSKPESVPYKIEPQGEAIAWKRDGSGFFTLSEERDGIEAILYFYAKAVKE